MISQRSAISSHATPSPMLTRWSHTFLPPDNNSSVFPILGALYRNGATPRSENLSDHHTGSCTAAGHNSLKFSPCITPLARSRVTLGLRAALPNQRVKLASRLVQRNRRFVNAELLRRSLRAIR